MYMRRVTTEDAERIAEIYNWYILNTIITFETDVVSPQEMKKRIQKKIIQHDWLVGEANQEVIGYAYYGPFRPRSAYHDTVESTIYVSPSERGERIRQGSVRSIAGVSTEPRVPRSRGSYRVAKSTKYRLT
jgi:L-amino acid N-acyltransferase YncA